MKTRKKLLSLFLAIAMMVTMLPIAANAGDDCCPPPVSVEPVEVDTAHPEDGFVGIIAISADRECYDCEGNNQVCISCDFCADCDAEFGIGRCENNPDLGDDCCPCCEPDWEDWDWDYDWWDYDSCVSCGEDVDGICLGCGYCADCDGELGIGRCGVCGYGDDCCICYCHICHDGTNDICPGCGWCADCDAEHGYGRCGVCGYCDSCCDLECEDDVDILPLINPCTREDRCMNCDICGRVGGRHGFGRVTGGGDIPAVADALAVLRFIVGLSSPVATDADARGAANIYNPGMGAPELRDALAILRFIVGLESPLSPMYR